MWRLQAVGRHPIRKKSMKRATPLVLLLFTLSGASGLIYEIVWIRQLSHLLGGTSYAISIVLAAFMGGLALGSRHFGPRADRSRRPLRIYAGLEFGIAGLACLVYLLISLAPPAYVAVARLLPDQAIGLLRWLVAVLLLLPPTFLMGGTLPVLSRVIVRSSDKLGSGLGLLYGVNTFGAVLGCFFTGFTLIAALGHLGSTALAVLINLLIGVSIWFIDRAAEPLPVSGAESPATASSGANSADGESRAELPAEMNRGLLALIFALSGFASLGYELYWTRGLQHFLGNSTYSFSAMLTTFLLGLALGGWLGGRLVDRVAVPSRLLGWVQIAIGATAMGTVLLLWQWLPGLNTDRGMSSAELSWNAFLLMRFATAALVMIVPTVLTGMTFPIVNRIGIRDLSNIGKGVGGLYFANTVGSICGSLAAGFVLLPLLGAKGALVVTACLSALLGLIVHLGNRRRGSVEPWIAMGAFILMVGMSPTLFGIGKTILSDTQEAGDRVLFDKEDHAAETRVYVKPSGILQMSVDGHHIGGNEPGILRKEKILAHLPMALVPGARRTLSIGLGSGITLGTLALYEGIEELVCVEIVPGVVEGARRFSQYNNRVLSDPRVRLHVGDGVQFLLTDDGEYQLISSDSKLNPEYSGNAPLLSRDYYELCRDRLSEDGVMVQWLATHLPHSEIKTIIRSFDAAFPHVALFWYDSFNLILVGSRSPMTVDMDHLRATAENAALAADLKSLQLENPYVIPSLFVTGREALLANLGSEPLNTWARPRLEFSMARAFRVKGAAYHEDDNLRWLYRMLEPEQLPLRGEFDAAVMERFRVSAASLLEGYGQGGGVSRLNNAIQIFEAGLAANPDDRRLAAHLEIIGGVGLHLEEAYGKGNLKSAEELVRLGLSRMDKGDPRGAMIVFDEAFALDPDDDSILYNRLLALRALGRMGEFVRDLANFRDRFPRDPRGFSMEGRARADAGEFAEAVEFFEQALKLDPDNAVYLNNLATALARVERYGEAGEYFARTCDLRPEHPGAAYFAAASFSMAGRTKDAAHWMRFCLERGLAEREQFETGDFFENLRASEHWDPGPPRD